MAKAVLQNKSATDATNPGTIIRFIRTSGLTMHVTRGMATDRKRKKRKLKQIAGGEIPQWHRDPEVVVFPRK